MYLHNTPVTAVLGYMTLCGWHRVGHVWPLFTLRLSCFHWKEKESVVLYVWKNISAGLWFQRVSSRFRSDKLLICHCFPLWFCFSTFKKPGRRFERDGTPCSHPLCAPILSALSLPDSPRRLASRNFTSAAPRSRLLFLCPSPSPLLTCSISMHLALSVCVCHYVTLKAVHCIAH